MKNIYTKVPTSIISRRPLSGICSSKTRQTPDRNLRGINDVRAFTLIELLVVILIIGILAAVALPQYKFAVAKTRLVQLVTAAQSIKQAEEVYYLANGEYTNDWTVLDVDFAGNVSSTNSRYFGANTGWGAELDGIAANWVALWDDRVPGVRLYYIWDHAPTQPGSKRCYALQTSSAANELCKYITKRTSHNATDGKWHNYMW